MLLSITSSFYAARSNSTPKANFFIKKAGINIILLQKSAKTAIRESRVSFGQQLQNAARLFIILLSFAGFLIVSSDQAPAVTPFLYDHHYTYLRFCVIR